MAAPSPKRALVQGRGALPFPLPRLLAQDLFRLIRSVHGQGVSILLVEQNVHQAPQIADRGYVLEKGEVNLVGTGEESLRDEYEGAFWGMSQRFTITSKVVLILGRFTPERKAVLDALREELRRGDYLPVLFDFDKPASKDLTGTVQTLANMARFVIADLRGGYQNSRASRPATRNMQAAWSSDWMTKPSRP